MRESSIGRKLPDAGKFEYFLSQKGELSVTPLIAERFSDGNIVTASNVLLDGERIGRFVKFYSDGRLMRLQYNGIVPDHHNGHTGAGSGEIVLEYYLRRHNDGNGSTSNGLSSPFP